MVKNEKNNKINYKFSYIVRLHFKMDFMKN